MGFLGVPSNERRKAFFTFLALFTLLSSYYLIKPLREALYFREFGADFLPIFHLLVIGSSFLLTHAFHQVLSHIDRTRVLRVTFPAVAVIHLVFGAFLNQPSKLVIILFCLWASVYFLLCLSLLWGVTNQRFSAQGGRKSYAFIWMGAILGALVGSRISLHIFEQGAFGPNLLFSTLTLLLAYFFLEMARPISAKEQSRPGIEAARVSRGKLGDLFSNRYLLTIAILVFSLTFCRSVFDYTTNAKIERELTREVIIAEYFKEDQMGISERGDTLVNVVLSIKHAGGEGRQKMLDKSLSLLPPSWSENPMAEFTRFQDRLQQRTGIFFGEVYLYQNILGLVLLLILKGGLIQALGLPILLLVVPVLYFFSSLALFFPIHLDTVQFLKILTGGFDYSWNNTGKELLFVPLDFEANLRFKPVIEGPVFRMGGALAAFSKMGLDSLIQISSKASGALIALSLVLILFWMKSAHRVAKRCQELEAEPTPTAEFNPA
ncbi:hypothetical protein HOF92_06095 [bacterium]|jgi:ATP/ADP translocase|nr:hypothetical protein [bacterium]